MSKFKTALSSIASKLTQVDIGGMTAYCIKSPSEAVNLQSLMMACDYHLSLLPPSVDDDLPVGDLDDALKGIESVVGKIRTQRQRNAALVGLQHAPAFRAILSIVDSEGRQICETSEDHADFLQILKLEPEMISKIEDAVGWTKFDADRKAAAEKEAKEKAAKPAKDGPKLAEEVSPNG